MAGNSILLFYTQDEKGKIEFDLSREDQAILVALAKDVRRQLWWFTQQISFQDERNRFASQSDVTPEQQMAKQLKLKF